MEDTKKNERTPKRELEKIRKNQKLESVSTGWKIEAWKTIHPKKTNTDLVEICSKMFLKNNMDKESFQRNPIHF